MIASGRRCGRKLTVRYTGIKHNIPRYSCHRGLLDNGEPRCIAFGGLRVDDAIEAAVLKVVEPGAVAAAVAAEAELCQQRDQVREALERDLEAARYAADRAFRQYDAADPANRLVAGELETRWNKALTRVTEVETKIANKRAEQRTYKWGSEQDRLADLAVIDLNGQNLALHSLLGRVQGIIEVEEINAKHGAPSPYETMRPYVAPTAG